MQPWFKSLGILLDTQISSVPYASRVISNGFRQAGHSAGRFFLATFYSSLYYTTLQVLTTRWTNQPLQPDSKKSVPYFSLCLLGMPLTSNQ